MQKSPAASFPLKASGNVQGFHFRCHAPLIGL
ncbi:Uncharacterised protein [Vibrio cholerae]|nr:Uncharacterised protein [Vibrio cholerae]